LRQELSPEELQILASQRQAVLELMKEGRDLYLKNEKPVSSSHVVEIIRGWLTHRAAREG
jgi:hypothetical protein